MREPHRYKDLLRKNCSGYLYGVGSEDGVNMWVKSIIQTPRADAAI